MLFFNKKKKEKPKPKPTPYKAYVGKKEDRLEYSLYYWSQDDPLIDYLDIAFEILEKILDGYWLFISESEFEPEKHNRMLEYMKSIKDAEYVYDDGNIIEKKKGFHSDLLKAYFKSESNEGPEHEFRSFYIYGFINNMELKESVKAQDEILFKQCEDIWVEYEERFEGPSINIWIKRGFFDVYELINMSIETINKHGKNISLLYRDETEEG